MSVSARILNKEELIPLAPPPPPAPHTSVVRTTMSARSTGVIAILTMTISGAVKLR